MKTIVFVAQANEISPALLEIAQAGPGKEIQALTNDAVVSRLLKQKGIDCKWIEEYLSQDEQKSCVEHSLRLLRNWNRDTQGNDLTFLDGIPMSAVINRNCFYHFNYAFKAVLNVTNILETEKPDNVVFVEDADISGGFYGISGANLYKEVLKIGRDAYLYNLTILEKPGSPPPLAGERRQRWKSLLTGAIKDAVIFFIDQFKSILSQLGGSGARMNILTYSATDISYFGKGLVRAILKAHKEARIYYIESQRNCFFLARLLNRPLEAFKTKETEEKIRRLSLQVSTIGQNLKDHLSQNPLFVFKGVDLGRLMGKFFDEFLAEKIFHYINFAVLLREGLMKLDIDLIVLSNSTTDFSILLSFLGREKGIPVLHVPHAGDDGAYVEEGKRYVHPEHDTRFFPFHHSHEIVAMRFRHDRLVEEGISPDKLILTGLPRYDIEIPNRRASRAKAREALGFAENETIVLLGTDLVWNQQERMSIHSHIKGFEALTLYEELISRFSGKDNYRLVFKFRPGDLLLEFVKDVVESNRHRNISVFHDKLELLCLASDISLMYGSTTGLEAMFYGLVVIKINLGSKKAYTHIGNGCIEIDDIKKLPGTLERLKNDRPYFEERLAVQRKYLEAQFFHRAGSLRKTVDTVFYLAALGKRQKSPANPV